MTTPHQTTDDITCSVLTEVVGDIGEGAGTRCEWSTGVKNSGVFGDAYGINDNVGDMINILDN